MLTFKFSFRSLHIPSVERIYKWVLFSILQVSGVGYNGCGHVIIAGQTLTPNSNLSITKIVEVRIVQLLLFSSVSCNCHIALQLPGYKLIFFVTGWLSV